MRSGLQVSDFIVVCAAGLCDGGQALNEGAEHLLHLLLCLHHAAFGFRLLEDDVLKATLHIVQAPQAQRLLGGRDQRFCLALQSAVFRAECGDILEDHMQQLQQHAANGGMVFGGKSQALAEVTQHRLQCAGRR